MKRMLLWAVLVFISLSLISCGGGGSSAPPTFTTKIFSDPVYDGDIAQDVTGTFTITYASSSQSILAGVDPTGTEYRAFLDIPLTGSGGVPGTAAIVSATLDIVIDGVLLQTATDTIPIRIDLVSFQPPTLLTTDFYRNPPTTAPTLATITISPPISLSDVGKHIPIDVTSLMNEAQVRGLPDFQVRISEDNSVVGTPAGRIQINDSPDPLLAPLLIVTYQ